MQNFDIAKDGYGLNDYIHCSFMSNRDGSNKDHSLPKKLIIFEDIEPDHLDSEILKKKTNYLKSEA